MGTTVPPRLIKAGGTSLLSLSTNAATTFWSLISGPVRCVANRNTILSPYNAGLRLACIMTFSKLGGLVIEHLKNPGSRLMISSIVKCTFWTHERNSPSTSSTTRESYLHPLNRTLSSGPVRTASLLVLVSFTVPRAFTLRGKLGGRYGGQKVRSVDGLIVEYLGANIDLVPVLEAAGEYFVLVVL